jgi:hypothetical protein
MKNNFTSALKAELKAFLNYKRSLGFRYERPEGTLKHFDRHVLERCRSERRTPDLRSLVQTWLAKGHGRKAITVASDLRVIRQFCLYRRRSDPGGFVPDREWFPQCVESQFIPHILSEAQVRRILQQVSRSRGTDCSGWRSIAPACDLARPPGSSSLIWIYDGACCGCVKAKAAPGCFHSVQTWPGSSVLTCAAAALPDCPLKLRYY